MTRTVRLYRVRIDPGDERGSRLVLTVDGRALDLTRWLKDHAPTSPSDVCGLLAQGFFESASIERALRTGHWLEIEQPRELDLPIEARSVGKILALGKNFREHAAEFGEAVPEQPLFFNKGTSR